MKLKLLFLYTLIPVAGYSQVGINTSNPQNTFHIDGSKDNASTGAPTATQQANDVIVTTSGNVGLGTVSPSAKLEINNGTVNGALKIIDGTQGDGKVLTSDANGLATWKSPTVTNVTGVTPSSSTPYGTSTDKYMNAYVDVPQGNWFVFMGFLVNGANAANTNYASRLTLSSSTTAIEETNFSFISGNRYVLTQISNGNAGAVTFGMFSSGIVRVSVSAPSVRLYVWDNASRSYGNTSTTSLNSNGENYIFAIKAN